MTASGASLVRLVEAARGGDENAFRQLVEGHRSDLLAHCYRMLGSLHDAEDALQDTLLRAWRALSGFQSGRPLRPWLYKIATNVCIDAIARRPKRMLPSGHGPPAPAGAEEPTKPLGRALWIEPYPDDLVGAGEEAAGPEARSAQREAVELSFVAALQYLPPR